MSPVQGRIPRALVVSLTFHSSTGGGPSISVGEGWRNLIVRTYNGNAAANQDAFDFIERDFFTRSVIELCCSR